MYQRRVMNGNERAWRRVPVRSRVPDRTSAEQQRITRKANARSWLHYAVTGAWDSRRPLTVTSLFEGFPRRGRTVLRGSLRAVRRRGLHACGRRDGRPRNASARVGQLGLRGPAAAPRQPRPRPDRPPAAALLLV